MAPGSGVGAALAGRAAPATYARHAIDATTASAAILISDVLRTHDVDDARQILVADIVDLDRAAAGARLDRDARREREAQTRFDGGELWRQVRVRGPRRCASGRLLRG